ncbi:unnamed protein product [Staurois parvus]|uniref:Uncharacterized protein n=1 Tax=Staurois parvus TaxID=386267 RepID=A0ABN9EZ80_9NEOB|nr:unnamed protein product [Staurois parvus]
MTRDCRHSTGDARDCRHSTGDGQRLQTYYRRWPETADIVQEMARDCRHSTGDGQRLQT